MKIILHEDIVMRKICVIPIVLFAAAVTIISAQNDIKLPEPKIRGSLMKALQNRSTYRNYSTKDLSPRHLSEVLWAAYGVNSKTGRRTVGTAYNSREMRIYVLKRDGSFLYNADKQLLELITSEDTRGLLASQDYVKSVPVQLVYVADFSASTNRMPRQSREHFSTIHTGQIAQNVYLYCASQNLATVLREPGNKDQIAKKLKLGSESMIIAAQCVGYPAGR